MTYQCDEDKGRELESEGAALSDKGARKGVKHVQALGKIRHKELQVQCCAVGTVFGVTCAAGRRQDKAARVPWSWNLDSCLACLLVTVLGVRPVS